MGSYQQATTAAQATPFTPRRAGLHWNSPLGLTIYASVFSLEQIGYLLHHQHRKHVWRTKAVRPWLAKYEGRRGPAQNNCGCGQLSRAFFNEFLAYFFFSIFSCGRFWRFHEPRATGHLVQFFALSYSAVESTVLYPLVCPCLCLLTPCRGKQPLGCRGGRAECFVIKGIGRETVRTPVESVMRMRAQGGQCVSHNSQIHWF